jgi:F0F1-type ATP synthase delta subunit
MALADTYAKVIREKGKDVSAQYVESLIAFMKSKGHLSLLPSVVRILEREPETHRASIVVARAEDAKKFARSIADSLKLLGTEVMPAASVDARIVGGHIVRAGSQIVDKSFRNALVEMYRKTVSH